MLFHIKQNFSSSSEILEGFNNFVHGFLLHLKLRAMQTAGKGAIDVHRAFHISFTGFVNICGDKLMDGMWAGLVVDLMIKLLTQYSIAADKELKHNR